MWLVMATDTIINNLKIEIIKSFVKSQIYQCI